MIYRLSRIQQMSTWTIKYKQNSLHVHISDDSEYPPELCCWRISLVPLVSHWEMCRISGTSLMPCTPVKGVWWVSAVNPVLFMRWYPSNTCVCCWYASAAQANSSSECCLALIWDTRFSVLSALFWRASLNLWALSVPCLLAAISCCFSHSISRLSSCWAMNHCSSLALISASTVPLLCRLLDLSWGLVDAHCASPHWSWFTSAPKLSSLSLACCWLEAKALTTSIKSFIWFDTSRIISSDDSLLRRPLGPSSLFSSTFPGSGNSLSSLLKGLLLQEAHPVGRCVVFTSDVKLRCFVACHYIHVLYVEYSIK